MTRLAGIFRRPRIADPLGLQPPRTRNLLGVDFAVLDYEEACLRIESMAGDGDSGYVCHAAVNALLNARREPQVAAALAGASLTVPDGMPIVWALRSLGERIEDRVYGPDLMLKLCERSVATGLRHFLYGGRDRQATVALAAALRQRFPDIAIAGSWTPPYRELTAAEEAEVVALIDGGGADIVWVGTGSPRQEKWMAAMRPRLRAPVLVGVGAAFDFHAGLVAQAPGWMQRRGLEWAYRLLREPRRLAPRYLRDNPAFLGLWARQWLAERHRR
jgi:N-acetylglucosaminyldiphosphoundecaprenol N-acetyl-beta-D-mannosaminyltransferase